VPGRRREASAGIGKQRRQASGDNVKLNEVFTPGGQPSVTYISRKGLNIEADLKKAVAQQNSIVSLTGPTKSGKTVLCRNVLDEYDFVWIEGGQIKHETEIWTKICDELNFPIETTERKATGWQGSVGVGASAETGIPSNKVGGILTAGGSRLSSTETTAKFSADAMAVAMRHLIDKNVCLVIDDFHYIPDTERALCIRSLKGPVFNGLKLILLSTPHRAFDAIKAETEITGRFKHVTVPPWSQDELVQIAEIGFKALNAVCDGAIVSRFSKEAQGSPLLMQQFCWNLCYDSEITQSSLFKKTITKEFPVERIFNEVAKDAGLPIYEKLAKGPQSRTDRMMRPTAGGGSVDIYEAILLAIAATGPREKLTYDQIRTSLNAVLIDKVPQKLEVSNALNNLASIAEKESKGGERPLDWDGNSLDLVLTDPFLRFYLRWNIKPRINTGPNLPSF
jgi:hypothetical protein